MGGNYNYNHLFEYAQHILNICCNYVFVDHFLVSSTPGNGHLRTVVQFTRKRGLHVIKIYS